MKMFITTISSLLVCCLAFSQSQIGKINFQKQDRQAIVCYCPYKSDVTEGAIKKRMSQLGNKAREKGFLGGITGDGFIAFKPASVPDLQRDMMNIYFKVEKKGVKENDDCVIYMLMTTPTDQFISYSDNAKLVENAKTFLNNMIPQVDAYNLDLQIADQENLIAKSTDKLNNLAQDSVDLVRKKSAIEDKLRQNAQDRHLQQGEIEREHRLLDALRSKRKKLVLTESVAKKG